MAERSARPQASSSDPGADRDLPAPYQDPWGLLRRDLRAVLASLRLKLQELWRRNREGDLSVPGFWPAGLAGLFWPLVLLLLLALPLALGRLGSSRAEPPAAVPVQKRLVTAPGPDGQGRELPAAATAPADAVLPGASEPPEAPSAPAQAASASAQAASASALAAAEPAAPELALDPLLQLVAEDDPEHLIASAHPLPADGLLQLSVTADFSRRPLRDRSDWAGRWQRRAADLGYDRLELLDGQGRLLGRKALVGSGMILLDVDADS